MQESGNVAHIIHGCVDANRVSQKEFYRSFYGFAMAICLRYCNTEDDAMEVVNDGFLKIFRELKNFSPRYENYEASLRGWMKSIFVNTSIDHYRKNHKNLYVSDLDNNNVDITDSEASAIDKMSYKEIIELVQKLSPVYRTVFNLFVIDGFKHEEIARQLNISAGTSKSNLFKAKANIQKMIKDSTSKNYERKAV